MDVTEDLGLALADVFAEKNPEEIGSPGVVFVTSNLCKFFLVTDYYMSKQWFDEILIQTTVANRI